MTTAIEAVREEWLAARRQGIGASEVAAVLGVHPYMSAYSLWHLKRGLIEEPEESEPMTWGKLLEPVVSAKYAQVTGRTLIDHGRFASRRSEAYPFLSATLDYEIAPVDERGPGALEIKTTGSWVEPQWKEEPPLHVQTQLQTQLLVTGFSWGSIAVLVGGQKFEWMDHARNDELCAIIVEKCRAFWALVENGTPPPVDGSSSTANTLKGLYPGESGEVITLAPEADHWTQVYLEARAAEGEAEKLKKEAGNHLRALIGSASEGVAPGGQRWTLHTVSKAAHQVKASEYRVLHAVKAKGK